MHLRAVLIFWAGVDAGDAHLLADVLRTRVAGVPRLRRRVEPVVFPLGAAHWVEDEAFDPAGHGQRGSVPAPGGRAELAARVAELLAAPLPRSRPLWGLHVLDGLADGSVAVLAKIHHSLADGLRAAELAFALVDDATESDRRDRPVPKSEPRPAVARAGAGLVGAVGSAFAAASLQLDPRTAASALSQDAERAWSATTIAASLLHTLSLDPPMSWGWAVFGH